MSLYAITIFLSAFLLFQVQPLIAKIILPWFGGSAAVWSAALLFFQLLLLAGYAYAHCSIRFLKPRAQMMLHVALLAVSCVLLPILPSPVWKPTAAGDPTFRILMLLTATIGLPYFLLSSTSPLLQAWYVRRSGSGMPYRLFALSNFGSMLALVTFPFLVEPRLTSRHQAYSWSAIYVAFALLCAAAAWASRGTSPEAAADALPAGSEAAAPAPRPRFGQLVLWVALSACASTLLISVTTHLSQNVAPIPLLWVLPLTLYLVTFILAFESDRIYNRGVFAPLVLPALGWMAYMIYDNSGNPDIRWMIPGFALGLFICCMLCHGELARRRPAPQHLTLFYLMVSVGGALGGLFVALIAPRVFTTLIELPLGLVACGVLALIVLWDPDLPQRGSWPLRFYSVAAIAGGVYMTRHTAVPVEFFTNIAGHDMPASFAVKFGWGMAICGGLALAGLWKANLSIITAWPVRAVLAAGVGLIAGYFSKQERQGREHVILQARNFYGALQVREDPPGEGEAAERTLMHGTINHGSQLLDPKRQYETISYYGPKSGIGRAIFAMQTRNGPLRVGVVGLGAGVLSNTSRKGDFYRIYEINPLVPQIAQTQFSYYPHSAADKNILMGDARLVLERQESQQYDLIAVDAFSSDAIPIHLLTQEAVALYFRHLKPNGILALHISNRYLDLEPVCARDAWNLGKQAMVVDDTADDASYYSASTWVLLTGDASWFQSPFFKAADMHPAKAASSFRAWTDDYSNIIQILSLR